MRGLITDRFKKESFRIEVTNERKLRWVNQKPRLFGFRKIGCFKSTRLKYNVQIMAIHDWPKMILDYYIQIVVSMVNNFGTLLHSNHPVNYKHPVFFIESSHKAHHSIKLTVNS